MSGSLFELDPLQLYFGDDYYVNENIILHQPTIGEIVEYGEKEYFSMIHTLTAIPSDMKSQLWDTGIDYMEIKDFHLFILLTRNLTPKQTSLILGDLDLSAMKECLNKETEEIVLLNFETGVVIDELIYMRIVNFLRVLHNITPKVERAYNPMTKKMLIEESREQIKLNEDKPYKSNLLPLISAMVNSEGFKYKTSELKEIGIVQFMDSVRRIPMITQSRALLQGCYSGMIDTKNIKKSELNWLRDLDDEKSSRSSFLSKK